MSAVNQMKLRTLSGQRVIVTRAADRSGALSDMLSALGAEVVEIPLTRTVDAADGGRALIAAVADVERYDWVVVTSPEGARRMRDALGHRSWGPDSPRFAAVGQATAHALTESRDRGNEVPVDLIATVQTGAGLGLDFPSGSGRVLLAVARDAGDDFEQAARAQGWTVDRITTYATEPVSYVLDSDRRNEIMSCAAVTFTAPSAVKAWEAAFGTVAPPVIVAIGPTTAAAVHSAGLGPCVSASDHSLEGVVAAVVLALTGES